MIKNFEEYINEDYFSKLASRKDNGEVRKEKDNELVREFMRMINNGDYHFVSLDGVIPNAEILSENILIKFNEIEDFDSGLPCGYHVVTAEEYDKIAKKHIKLHKTGPLGNYVLTLNGDVINWCDGKGYSYILASDVHKILLKFENANSCCFTWGPNEITYDLIRPNTCGCDASDSGLHYIKIIRNV